MNGSKGIFMSKGLWKRAEGLKSVLMFKIHIYIWCPPPKTYVHITFAGICNILCLFWVAFWSLFFFGGYHLYLYIYICARRLHDLFVHFGRNAVRMRECQRMHSCPIPRPRPRFAQKSCGKSWKYQDQDPRFGKSWKYQDQDQDLHRSLVKNLGNTKTKIQDLENLGNTKTKTKICTEVLWKILEIPRSKIQFQDFSQTSVILVLVLWFSKSWILVLVFPRFSTNLGLGLGISNIFQILVLVLVFPRFSKSWILVLVFPRFSTRLLCKSWILVLVLGRNAFSGILW